MESTTSSMDADPAETTPEKVEPQTQHRWLEQLVGQWSIQGQADMGPDEPEFTFTGTEIVRSIGGFWTVADTTGTMPDGSTMTSITTLGYDPATQRFTGTFIASMMAHLWVYDGELDPSGTILKLDTEGPDFQSAEGATARMRDIIEIRSENQRLLRAEKLEDDGTYREFMRATYTRV